MVKIALFVALSILGITLVKGAVNKEECLKKFMSAAEMCREKVGAAASDIEDVIQQAPAAGKEGKCLRACIMMQYDVMDAGGKFIKAVALEHAKMYSDGDAAKLMAYNEVLDACADISVPADVCDAAVIYGDCFMEQAKMRGMDKFKF